MGASRTVLGEARGETPRAYLPREGVAVRYAWIDGVRDIYPLEVLCRVLSVSTSGFADWKRCDGPTQ